ncbi:hypothetical protein M0R72_13845 [Candidatus Pacearchaeota archaeon]|jgi:hypothetical protein|nr:hypothetical protein [Candidatus Pacearchaeota archaeon]
MSEKQGVLARMDELLPTLDPEGIRARALIAMRTFRANWWELGKLLTDIAYGGDYKEWGHDDFEVYCARELGLKKENVRKLMSSYNYLRQKTPEKIELLDRGNLSFSVPDYKTVEMLKRVSDNDTISEDQVNEFHAAAFSGEIDESELRKKIREAIAETTLPEMDSVNADRHKELAAILRTARALREKLARTKYVAGGLKERAENILAEIEALD